MDVVRMRPGSTVSMARKDELCNGDFEPSRKLITSATDETCGEDFTS